MVWENNLSPYIRNFHMTGYIILKDLLFNKGFFVVLNFFKKSSHLKTDGQNLT